MPGDETTSLTDQLATDMAQRWECGERPLAEDFLNKHPELWQQAESAIDLVYEELCLRQKFGCETSPQEFFRRFPQWRAQLAVLLRCHQALEANLAPPEFPGAGDSLGEFELLAELGRGAHSRVFLATQPSLADRLVVLKVTPPDGREHESLARLQHTHIVPLYAVQHDTDRNLRVLCMPYFGGKTLDRLLDGLACLPPVQRRGMDILAELDRDRLQGIMAVPSHGPGRDYLARVSYVQAITWMGACLGSALEYAHERGLVHFDIKPSNVLIAADGQPMLLDFHLARPPLQPGGPPIETLGGTPGYMSPEQQEALNAVRQGTPIRVPVDDRSDVYSLGLLLYRALGGPVPLPPGGPPGLEGLNAQVSVGLADIVHKSLAARPADRYADAASLAADLRRHLTDQPLRGVSNRSWMERWRKWRRRRPYALRLFNMLVAVLLAGAAVLTFLALSLGERMTEAKAHLTRGREIRLAGRSAGAIEILRHGLAVAESLPFSRNLQLELRDELHLAAEQAMHQARGILDQGRKLRFGGQYAEAATTLKQGLAGLQELPGSELLSEAFRAQLQLTEKAALARELHTFVDSLRFHAGGVDAARPPSWPAARSQCSAFWAKRQWLTASSRPDHSAELRLQIKEDLLDLAILWTGHAGRSEVDKVAASREGLRILMDAEELFGPSPVLCRERQRHAEALGLAEEVKAESQRAAALTPRNAWDHYALGRSLLRDGRYEEAATALRQAVRQRPGGLWPHYYAGVCAFRLCRYEDAVASFSVCVALEPASGRCLTNRGLAYARLQRPDRALEDYDQALGLEPNLAMGALNRGALHLGAKRHAEAEADFRRALGNGADPGLVHYYLALTHSGRGNRDAARASLRIALQHAPDYTPARQLFKQLQGQR
jgi:serine/threonine protein kinase/tetratricopeptide (TPR) repeat protein